MILEIKLLIYAVVVALVLAVRLVLVMATMLYFVMVRNVLLMILDDQARAPSGPMDK